MRPAVELSKLNRVGDRFWPGKPQATESSQRCMHAGITAITELAVKNGLTNQIGCRIGK
jgi:hypothetical protein